MLGLHSETTACFNFQISFNRNRTARFRGLEIHLKGVGGRAPATGATNAFLVYFEPRNVSDVCICRRPFPLPAGEANCAPQIPQLDLTSRRVKDRGKDRGGSDQRKNTPGHKCLVRTI